MANFSERLGYKPMKAIQFEYVSETLRNRIWNLFYMADIQRGGDCLLNAFKKRLPDNLRLRISSWISWDSHLMLPK